VVASEVKYLAKQAKHATDTISKAIEQLNSVAADVAGSLTAIKSAIAGVNEFIASTAAAVEEQSIVTQDMSSNMQRASAELS
jgi:methyl-accepting chemotaxis protein